MIWSKVLVLVVQQGVEQLCDVVDERFVVEALANLREADAKEKDGERFHLGET